MTGAHDVDETTIPRSRLLAGLPTSPGPVATPEPAPPPLLVRPAPEPARLAARRTGPALELRIAPWAVPAAEPPPPPVRRPATAEPAPAPVRDTPSERARSHTRSARHAVYAPTEGAVDLTPERATPLTDPPRRRWWRRSPR